MIPNGQSDPARYAPDYGQGGPTVDSFRDRVGQLLKARFPLLYVETFEEQRVLAELAEVASDVEMIRTPRTIATWSPTDGLRKADGTSISGCSAPAKALEAALRMDEPTILVFRDLHAQLGDGSRPADPQIVRLLRDVATAFKSGMVPRSMILVSPLLRIPPELEKDITLVDFPLPDEASIRELLDNMIDANSAGGRIRVDVDDNGRELLVKAAQGLTLNEAENAFARAMVNDGVLDLSDVDVVLEEKQQTIRKSGLLEFVPVEVGLDDVGGLQTLKRWLAKRNNSWLAEAAAYGVPAPKGVLVTGVPGCGKSLTAKAMAAAWGLPLLRLDIGRVFAGLVGSSEQNMRTAIRTAEAIAPCVLWIDEIEKGFSGTSSGGGDSGTSSRVFGSFLTWMQEKSRPVFVMATANNIDQLPPEFMRKGRFDEIFFVDLPTHVERMVIWQVHLRRRLSNDNAGGSMTVEDGTLRRLADATEGYAGAEIEQAVIAGLFDAYADRRPLQEADVLRAVSNTVPLSVTQSEQIAGIRRWADVRAVAATAPEDRAEYDHEQFGSDDAPPKAPRPKEDSNGVPQGPSTPRLARGGRTVDF